MNNTVLSLQDISLCIPSRERPILQGISFDVYAGDFILLLGSNGSGKSSLLRVINGLACPSNGQALFQEKQLLPLPIHTRAKSIVTLSQDLSLSTFSELSILENCLVAMHRHKAPLFSLTKKEDKQSITKKLQEFHPSLANKLHQKVGHLSGGERQALALAMTFWNTPSLLLLDEHTSALDPAMASALMELTYSVAKSRKVPTIVTTHKLEDALRFGNRIIGLKNGSLCLDISGKDKQNITYKELLALYSF